MIEHVISCGLCHTSRPFGLFMHQQAAAADQFSEARLPVCVTVRSCDVLADTRAAERCLTLRASQLPIESTRRRRVS